MTRIAPAISDLIAALYAAREHLDTDEVIPFEDPRCHEISRRVHAAAEAVLAERFPGRKIRSDEHSLIGYNGSTYFEIDSLGAGTVTVRISGHANTSSLHGEPEANITAGDDAIDIEVELDAAAEALAELDAEAE